MKTMRLWMCVVCGLLFASGLYARKTGVLDEIVFGHSASEKKHGFSAKASQVVTGGLGEEARVLLPIPGERVEGGHITFTMKVDPEKQNYFTARFWGSDSGNSNILILFCEGKQIGYRHLGDYDVLDIANEDKPYPGRFTYTTLPLPISMTRGKKEIELSIRSTGRIFRYGETFDAYQKVMEKPSKALYKGYTHTETCFQPSEKEKKQIEKIERRVRTAPGAEVMEEVRQFVNRQISGYLNQTEIDQETASLLAYAYHEPWTVAYRNKDVVEKVIRTADRYYERYAQNPKSVYDGSWLTVGPLCQALNSFIPEIREIWDEKMPNGKTRRENWTAMCRECVDYAKTHRRSYTNQSMIVDLHLYNVNRMLSILAPEEAMPVWQTLKFIYESMGIAPWSGSLSATGEPTWPLGKSYYQFSPDGLSKELGYVGGYGEILNWMVHLYEVTGERGLTDTRDPLIRAQMLKIMHMRSHFRYPTLDNDGYAAMRGESVIGWRDHGYYSAGITYGERGYHREGTPIMAAAATLDPEAVAYARQMMEDNQFFAVVKEKMKDRGLNSTYTLLRLPGEYDLIMKQPRREGRLPMSDGMPDVLFSDEEVGVVALKNGDEILYTSLYWRANFAVNFLARVHYITPECDRVATVFEDIRYTPSGFTYTRPERNNLYFSPARNFYPEVKSAHTGEQLPIAKAPEGVHFEPGQESVYAGKGDFYTLRYGKYLIAMNCTPDRTFDVEVPAAKSVRAFPSRETVEERVLQVEPKSTVVLIVE